MTFHSWIHSVASLYQSLVKWSSNLQSAFLLWMRLTWGPQFFLLGAQKLGNIQQASDFYTSIGLSHPYFHAYFTGYVELIGGLLLIVGLASRLAAIPLVFTTLTLLSTAHSATISGWKLITHPSLASHEAPYPFIITALLVLIFGPGRLSLDGWIKRQFHQKNR